ncbi:MAG: hypothetical protein LBT40_03575 [Deltaproteobacteria bacterium]|jgi:hypothetical protein|nr:hypothetical protein [Deltaproteobacteria bacterium]
MPLDFIQPKLDGYFDYAVNVAELGMMSPAPILFCNGYLTIDSRSVVEIHLQLGTARIQSFIFKIPNMEVEICFKAFMFGQIFNRPLDYYRIFTKNLNNALLNKDSQQIANLLHDLLAGITSKQLTPDENYCLALFHAAFVGAGIEVLSKTGTSEG